MLKRKTPLRRTGIKRSKGLRRRNPERAATRRAECFGEQAEFCRLSPCVVCLSVDRHRPPTLDPARWIASWVRPWKLGHAIQGWNMAEPHHEPPRSCGGKDSDTVPLCRAHHDERHRVGRRAFEDRYSLDLRQCARILTGEIAECE